MNNNPLVPKYKFYVDGLFTGYSEISWGCFAYTIGHKKIISLPENFNLDSHIEQYPPEDYGFTKKFNKDKIIYFLGLFASIPARNSDLIDDSGFIPIHMGKIRNEIKDIKLYVDYLINTGVVICNTHYEPGVRSRGYKWNDIYENKPFQAKLTDCRYADIVHEYEQSPDIKNYPYLFHWYEQRKLLIDRKVERYAFDIKEKKMQDTTQESWDKNDKGKYKYPVLQYKAAICNIGKIQHQRFEAHIDTNIHRLHSTLTNLQSDLKNFITYDNNKLVSIDIKNCQPYMSCLIFHKEFWEKDSPLPLNLYNLPDNIQYRMHTPSILPIMIGRLLAESKDDDFSEYINLVSTGVIYEEMIKVAKESIGEIITRAEAKKLIFYILFSSNQDDQGNQGHHDDSKINQMRKIFSQLFPKVNELYRLIKTEFEDVELEKQHNRLSCLLQSIESKIVLHRICKRIWEEGNQQIPIFTIHDSVVTTVENKDYVKDVMIEELTNCIGVKPTLKDEYWDKTNITGCYT